MDPLGTRASRDGAEVPQPQTGAALPRGVSKSLRISSARLSPRRISLDRFLEGSNGLGGDVHMRWRSRGAATLGHKTRTCEHAGRNIRKYHLDCYSSAQRCCALVIEFST